MGKERLKMEVESWIVLISFYRRYRRSNRKRSDIIESYRMMRLKVLAKVGLLVIFSLIRNSPEYMRSSWMSYSIWTSKIWLPKCRGRRNTSLTRIGKLSN